MHDLKSDQTRLSTKPRLAPLGGSRALAAPESGPAPLELKRDNNDWQASSLVTTSSTSCSARFITSCSRLTKMASYRRHLHAALVLELGAQRSSSAFCIGHRNRVTLGQGRLVLGLSRRVVLGGNEREGKGSGFTDLSTNR